LDISKEISDMGLTRVVPPRIVGDMTTTPTPQNKPKVLMFSCVCDQMIAVDREQYERDLAEYGEGYDPRCPECDQR
jgi:hypothetical protein